MRKTAYAIAAAMLIGGGFAVPAPASAQVARGATALEQSHDGMVQNVRWRGRHHGWGHRHRGYGWGPAVGGFAAGAIIGGAAAYPYYYGAPYYDEPAYYYYRRPYYAAPVSSGIGDYCQTPVRTCKLINPAELGVGCSCRVAGGRARGTVIP